MLTLVSFSFVVAAALLHSSRAQFWRWLSPLLRLSLQSINSSSEACRRTKRNDTSQLHTTTVKAVTALRLSSKEILRAKTEIATKLHTCPRQQSLHLEQTLHLCLQSLVCVCFVAKIQAQLQKEMAALLTLKGINASLPPVVVWLA